MNDDVPKNDARLLSELTREARLDAPPEVDFDRLEAALFERIDREPARLRPRSFTRAYGGVAAIVAAAAAGVFYLGTTGQPAPVAVKTPAPIAPVVTTRTEHVEAGTTSRSFTKAGLATWVLEPGAVADVTDEGERVIVALAAGAIHVDVVPQPVKERFVVLADRTRVAVHGTAFRVARAGEKVDVDVEHGVVAVGGLDAAPRWMMDAPLGGTFRLDASAGELRPLVPFTVKLAPPPATPRVPTSGPSATPSAIVQVEKRIEASELRARTSALASDCFSRSPLPPNVHVTVDTTATIVADVAGAVTVSFDPPLAPGVEACVRDGLRALKAQSGTVDAPLTLASRK